MEWCKLYSTYPDDPAIAAAGEAAEVLFFRSIAYATEKETEGFIPVYQLPRFGLPKIEKRVEALVTHNLWIVTDGGWRIRSYERLQAEVSAIVRRRRADRVRKRRGRGADMSAETSAEDSAACPQDRVSVSGYVSSSGVETETEKIPQPPPSGGRRCTRHGRKRRGCADCDLPAVAVLPEPCGNCSPSRYIEDAAGRPLRPCPACHPKGMTA